MKRQLSVAVIALAAIWALDAGAAPKPRARPPAKEVAVAVTAEGFEPAEIRVGRGQPIRLVLTRKVERTCATEIVIKALKIEKPLPLETPVVLELAGQPPGELRFGCAMDMIVGKVIVE